jgi:hypothetical protein
MSCIKKNYSMAVMLILLSISVASYKTPKLGLSENKEEVIFRIVDSKGSALARCSLNLSTEKHALLLSAQSNADGIVRVPFDKLPNDEKIIITIFGRGPCFVRELYPIKSELANVPEQKFQLTFDCSKAKPAQPET